MLAVVQINCRGASIDETSSPTDSPVDLRTGAWTAVRRRRLGSEAVQPPPASFLSS